MDTFLVIGNMGRHAICVHCLNVFQAGVVQRTFVGPLLRARWVRPDHDAGVSAAALGLPGCGACALFSHHDAKFNACVYTWMAQAPSRIMRQQMALWPASHVRTSLRLHVR